MGPEHPHRGRGGPSLILAVDTQLACFGRPPDGSQGLSAVPATLFFFLFLTLLINITLTTLKTGCPCAGAVVLLSLGRARGVWAPCAAQALALSLLLGGVTRGPAP